MNVATLPQLRARHDSRGRAVADARGALDNAGLLEQVTAAAAHLQELGVGRGDVVAVCLKNRLEFVVVLFAAWRLEAAVTPVNPSLTPAEIDRQLRDSGARLLVGEPAVRSDVTAMLDVGHLRRTGGPDVTPGSGPEPDSLALVVYTSGTTGEPKGVMLDHANLQAMTEMGAQALELTGQDRCLLILPLFHVNGIVVSILTPLLAGASVVIAERFDPSTFFATVKRERPTYFSAVPTIYSMLEALPATTPADTSSLRFAVSGAAPAQGDLLARFEARFGVPVVEGYGLSEGTCATTLNPVSGVRRPGTVGIALPGQELRIVRPDGTDVPPGHDGEVLVRGANVMRGYLGRPDATAEVLVDGWLHTGDLGRLDEDGYLTLTGRAKDLIIRGGENISPKEVEDVIAQHPGVQDVAVIGAPDERWGEGVVACVQPRPGAHVDVADLEARCAEHLSGYKRPTGYTLLGELPKNPVGKIDKRTLRDLVATS